MSQLSSDTEDSIVKECMINQAVINFALIGHVSNGKSTLARQLTGKDTRQHSKENGKFFGMTWKLGYTNGKIFQCSVCPEPLCYKSTSYTNKELVCELCGNDMKLVTQFSLVDCPGHNTWMSTMISGMSVVDQTILLEAINNPTIPEAQTVEHLNVAKLSNTPNLIVCINKLDLITRNNRHSVEENIMKFKHKLKNTSAEHSDIIPIASNFGSNLHVVCQYIAKCKIPHRQLSGQMKMIIIRSFDVNKVNTSIKDIQGGVVGGSILQGMLKLCDNIIIKPGFIELNHNKDIETKWICRPFKTFVNSLNAENTKLEKAIAGGLIGVGTDIDPSFTAKDGLRGNVVTYVDNEDVHIYEALLLDLHLLKGFNVSKTNHIILNHNASTTSAVVRKIYKTGLYEIDLIDRPICVSIGEKIVISMTIGNLQTMIGYGIVDQGISTTVIY